MIRYAVGPFILNTEQRVLYRDGEVLSIPPKAFDILLVLVEAAGQVATRETLRQRVWGDAFIEEANISKNVSLLRSRLASYLDDENPIKTVSKRGYQLMLPVNILDLPEQDGDTLLSAELIPSMETPVAEDNDADTESTVESLIDPAPQPPNARNVGAPQPARPFWKRPALWLAGTFLLLASVGLTWRQHRSYPTASAAVRQPAVAVLHLKNLSGNVEKSWIGVALQETIDAELAREGGVEVISGDRTTQAERDLGLSDAASWDDASLQSLGKRLHASVVLTGSYLPVDGSLRVDLQLRDLQSGATVTTYMNTVPQDALLDIVTQASARLRGAMQLAAAPSATSGPLTSKQMFEQSYAEGLRLSRSGDQPARAREVLSQAVLADPDSPLAREALAQAWLRLGFRENARTEAHQSLRLASSLPRPQELALKAHAYTILADYPQAIEALNELRHLDPQNPEYVLQLARANLEAGKLDPAYTQLEELREKSGPLRFDPRVPLSLALVEDRRGNRKAELLHAGEAIKLAQDDGSRSVQAAALRLGASAWDLLGNVDKALADLHAAQQICTQIGEPGGLGEALMTEGSVLGEHRLPGAEATLQHALAVATQIGDTNTTGQVMLALGNYHLGMAETSAAEDFYLKALGIAEHNQLRDLKLRAAANLAIPAMEVGDMPKALRFSQQALKIAEEDSAPAALAHANDTLAYVVRYTGNPAQALSLHQAALRFAKPLGDDSYTAAILEHIAVAQMTQGDLAASRKTFQSFNQASVTPAILPNVQLDDATLSYEEGQFDRVFSSLGTIAKDLTRPDLAAPALTLFAEIALKRGDTTKARSLAEEVLALRKQTKDDKDGMRDAQLLLANVQIQARDTSPAERELNSVLVEAKAAKNVEMMLRVRLAFAAIQQQKGRGDSGWIAIAAEAQQRGYGLIAAKAKLHESI